MWPYGYNPYDHYGQHHHGGHHHGHHHGGNHHVYHRDGHYQYGNPNPHRESPGESSLIPVGTERKQRRTKAVKKFHRRPLIFHRG